MFAPLKVFVGRDSRVPGVSEVCAFSMRRRASTPIEIHYLDRPELTAAGLYRRAADPLASTEFTYTRFLVPHLAGRKGLALYCDNDFLWLDDVAQLLEERREGAALQCVHHDHVPVETTKMDGAVQTRYPRKNWSSLMLFDCGHPAHRRLCPDLVASAPSAFLQRMQWLEDAQLGALAPRWNWLEGSSPAPTTGTPGAVHFTRGGPWLAAWRHAAYAELWLAEQRAWRAACALETAPGAARF